MIVEFNAKYWINQMIVKFKVALGHCRILTWYFILTYKKLTPQQLWKYCDNLLCWLTALYIYKKKRKEKRNRPRYYPKEKKKKKKNEDSETMQSIE